MNELHCFKESKAINAALERDTTPSIRASSRSQRCSSSSPHGAIPFGRTAAVITFILVAAAAFTAEAGVHEAFGPDAQSISLAGAGGVLSSDAAALFSCPAAMAFGPSSLGFGLFVGVNDLGIRLSPRPRGYDPGDVGPSSSAIPYRYRLNPREDPGKPPNLYGFGVGVTSSLGIDWLRLGGLFFIPLQGVGDERTHFADEREQYFSNTLQFELHGERLVTQQILFGGSVLLFPWLALGAGAQVNMRSRSDSSVLILNPADQTKQQINLDVDTGIDTGLLAGVALKLMDERLLAGITFRERTYFTVQGRAQVQVNGMQGTDSFPFEQPMSFVLNYTPRQVAYSLAWREQSWFIAADATWLEWSGYRDTHAENASFRNTYKVSAGGGLRVKDRAWVKGGLGWRPSPVPSQTGRTNYVDNDMLLAGLGASWDVDILGQNLETAVYSQVHIAITRKTEKDNRSSYPSCTSSTVELCDEIPDDLRDPETGARISGAQGLQTGNPGFPGFSSGGWVAVTGVQLVWRY